MRKRLGALSATLAISSGALVAAVACGLGTAGTGAIDSASSPDTGVASSVDATIADGSALADSGAILDAAGLSDASDASVEMSDAGDAGLQALAPDFAWYLLNEVSGSTAHDSTAHHFDILNLGAVTWDGGAVFDGTSTGGGVAVDASVRQPPLTITVWLTPHSRADSTSSPHATEPFPENAVSTDLPGNFGFSVGLNVWTDGMPDAALGVENVSDRIQLLDGGAFAALTEYFVAAVYDTMSSSVYVDGNLVFQNPTSLPASPNAAATLRLGFHNEDNGYGSRRFYSGGMRDARLWKRALGDGEIMTLFTNGPATTK